MDRFGKDLYIKLLSSFIFLLSFLPGSGCIIQWPRHLLNPAECCSVCNTLMLEVVKTSEVSATTRASMAFSCLIGCAHWFWNGMASGGLKLYCICFVANAVEKEKETCNLMKSCSNPPIPDQI